MFYRRPINGIVTRDRSFLVQPQIKNKSPLLTDLSFGFEWRSGRGLAQNISSNSIDATAYGISLQSPGILDNNYAGVFGLSNRVSISPSAPLTSFSDRDFSFATLFRFIYIGNDYRAGFFFAKHEYSDLRREVYALIEKDSYGYRLAFGIGGAYTTVSIPSFSASNWYLLVGIFDKTDDKSYLYLNNSLVQELDQPIASVQNINCHIGSRSNNGSSFDTFVNDLNMQYFYKWNRKITSTERNYLWNDGNLKFIQNSQ